MVIAHEEQRGIIMTGHAPPQPLEMSRTMSAPDRIQCARKRNRTLKTVENPTSGVVYTLLRRLGKGSHGNIFVASEDGSKIGSCVIKHLKRKISTPESPIAECDEETEFEFEDRLLNEYHAARFAVDKLGDEASRHIVPAKASFFVFTERELEVDANGTHIVEERANDAYIVFDNVVGTDLYEFSHSVLYGLYERRSIAIYNAVVMHIAERLCRSVYALSSIGLYHCDIKQSNVIVCVPMELKVQLELGQVDMSKVSDIDVRLIDLGLATATSGSAREFLAKNGRNSDGMVNLHDYVEYEDGRASEQAMHYVTTCIVRDPLSLPKPLSELDPLLTRLNLTMSDCGNLQFTELQIDSTFGFFELFSVAVCIQLMYDSVNNRYPWPKTAIRIRDTQAMPIGVDVASILLEMTGPLDNRLSADEYADKFAAIAKDLSDFVAIGPALEPVEEAKPVDMRALERPLQFEVCATQGKRLRTNSPSVRCVGAK